MRPLGSIVVICGSMYAGKSEELIRRARRALYAKRKVQVFKPSIDKRYDESMVVTHMGARHEAVPVTGVKQLLEKLDPCVQTLLIEECQFFDDSLVDVAVQLADRGVEVILAGLDQDFRRRPFGPMPQLLALADEVVKLKAICMHCGAPASHTYRMIDGKPANFHDPIVLIGATEAYEARCRNCFKLRGEPKSRVTLPKPRPRRPKS
ncbi:MAG: thymidine kinase [Armatimonadetes bacterium]|nr:thymidine kinase [Armatimonadota bacterium]